MKKILAFIIMCIFTLYVHGQGNYTLKFDKKDFIIENKGGIISIESLKGIPFFLEDTKAPALPYFPFRILRAPDAFTTGVNMTYDKELLYTDVEIDSNPAIETTRVKEKEKKPFRLIASQSSEKPVVLGKNGSRYGYNYSYLKVSPFEYDYQTKSLYFIPEITIALNDSRKNANNASEDYQSDKVDRIRELVINPNEAAILYPEKTGEKSRSVTTLPFLQDADPNEPVDYLIVTSEELAPAFTDLVKWKIQKGVHTRIVTTEYIDFFYQNSNMTAQEKVKSFIQLVYNVHNLKYVLLGGDGTVVPIQKCQVKANCPKGFQTDYAPCDLFYGCFGGFSFNWDTNGNGIVGEYSDAFSIDPQVYVTRIPVSTEQEAFQYCAKVIRYEENPFSLSGIFTKMLFVGAKVEGMILDRSDTHFKCEKAYTYHIDDLWTHGHDYLYDTGSNIIGYDSISASNLFNLIENNYHFIHNESHGDTLYYNFNTSDYNKDNASRQLNEGSTIFITSACETNAFDTDCLSKYLLKSTKGALAYFGSSREGLYHTNSVNIGPSLWYDTYFLQYLLSGQPSDAPYHYGAVAAEAKRLFMDEANSNETNGYRYLQFAINPMGDPEMPIYTDTPSSFSNVTINPNNNNTAIQVSTGGIPGCRIAVVSKDDNGETYFEVADNVSSYTFTGINTACYVTVTKHNYCPYTTTFHPITEIVGNSNLCGTEVYSVANLPSNVSVTWSLKNNPYNFNSMLQQNYPLGNQCTIILENNESLNDTLIATVVGASGTIAVLKKKVQTGWNFTGSYTLRNSSGSTSGPYAFTNGEIIGLTEGQTATLSSTYFDNAVITHTNNSNFHMWGNLYNSDREAWFTPNSNISTSITIHGVNPSPCDNFTFYVALLHHGILSPLLQIEGRQIKVSLNHQNADYAKEDNLTWFVDVSNVITGEIVYTGEIENFYGTLDASKWKSGIYAVKSRIGDSVIVQKIAVK